MQNRGVGRHDEGYREIAGQEASSSVPIPSLLPGPGDVERLINRLQKKDPYQIFKDPVTDAMVRSHHSLHLEASSPACFPSREGVTSD